MFSIINSSKPRSGHLAIGFLTLTIAIGIGYVRFSEHQSQLSAKPPSQYSSVNLEPVESTLGLQAVIPFNTIQRAAEQATEQPQHGNGERQSCKRILGLKVCATLQWHYLIRRAGAVTLKRNGESIRVSIPLALDGQISVDGRGGKIFGLRNKEVTGLLQLHADLHATIGEDWCPKIHGKLDYRWINDPQIQMVGNLKINMRKSANKALQRKLKDLDDKFLTLIDCQKFKTKVADNWKVHHIPVKFPRQQYSYLELVPRSAAATHPQVLDDHISVNLEMSATTEIVATKSNTRQLSLPNLIPRITAPGTVEFSLLINLPYTKLTEMVSEKLQDELQQQDGNRFSVTSFDIYPSENRLIFDLGFTASGFRRFLKTSGHLYLSALPVADANSNELRFEDLQFTRILDSELWSLLSTVLHQRILESLKTAATIDLAPRMIKLENSIIASLANKEKTAGIAVRATTPVVRLVTVNPESTSLAAILHVSTKLNATIPTEALLKH